MFHHLVSTELTFQRKLCSLLQLFLSLPLLWFLTFCPGTLTQFFGVLPLPKSLPQLFEGKDDRKFNRLCKAVLVTFLLLPPPLSPLIWWYLLLRLPYQSCDTLLPFSTTINTLNTKPTAMMLGLSTAGCEIGKCRRRVPHFVDKITTLDDEGECSCWQALLLLLLLLLHQAHNQIPRHHVQYNGTQ